jgi:hypothetical protein
MARLLRYELRYAVVNKLFLGSEEGSLGRLAEVQTELGLGSQQGLLQLNHLLVYQALFH